jgi:hypothetical protein
MRVAFWSSFGLLPLVSCMQVTTDTGSGTSGSSAGSGGSGSDDGGSGGTNCTLDPASQVVLCAGIGACPAVTVDPAVFPGCGFRASGSSTPLDLECLCGDSLCPMGVPTTCTQAAQLLQTQNVLGVCEQVAEGRCVAVVAPDAGAAVPSSCDRTCQAECGAAADCVQICGC